MLYNNGDKFEGEFKNDFPDRYGIFYSVLGFKYKGYFKYSIPYRILFFI